MARIRTLKPEILQDGKTASLDAATFKTFIGLILLADDYGNLHGHTEQVRGAIHWARSEDAERTGECLDTLVAVGLIRRYAVGNQQYIHVAGWKKHQRVEHPGKPMVPGPSETLATTSGKSHENFTPDLDLDHDQDQDLDLDHDHGARGSSAKASRANGTQTRPSAGDVVTTFSAFWSAYPRKVGKPNAQKAWEKQSPPLDACLAALEWQRRSPGWVKDGGQYVPHPATWINRRGWEDEPPAAAATAFLKDSDVRARVAAAAFIAKGGGNAG